jgi:hypothetical protein
LTSAALLAAGILKSNMAFSFWGGAFLLLLFLSAAGVAFEAARAAFELSSDELGFGFSAALPSQGYWFAGDAAVMRRASTLKRTILPWICADFHRRYRRGGESFLASALVADGSGECACGRPERGRWISDSFSLRVRDVLGMVRWERSLPERDEFVVAPEPRAFSLQPPSGGGGPDKSSPESFRRSDELLDSRKYNPGDDARRINWKQFGHSGELFLRVGEREPPPKARYLIVVDPAMPAGISRAAAKAYADDLIALAAGCALELSGRGARISIAAPGRSSLEEGDEPGDFSAEAGKLLSFLAGVCADSGSAAIDLPKADARAGAHRSRGTIILCPPASPRSEGIIAALAGQRPMVAVPLMRTASAKDFWISFLKRKERAASIPPWTAKAFNERASAYAERLGRTANADAHAL